MERRGFVEHFVSNRIKKKRFRFQNDSPCFLIFVTAHTHTLIFLSRCTFSSPSHCRLHTHTFVFPSPNPAHQTTQKSTTQRFLFLLTRKRIDTRKFIQRFGDCLRLEKVRNGDRGRTINPSRYRGGGLCFITVGWRTGSARHHRASS